jgi:hypothetical protein
MPPKAAADTVQNQLARLARRGGAVSAALGIVLALPIAGFVMRAALLESERAHGRDLGALLVSACTAPVAFDDAALVRETVEELAPSLGNVVLVRVSNASGKTLGAWNKPGASGSSIAQSQPIFGQDHARMIGRVDIGLATDRVNAAVQQLWLYLGMIAVLSLTLSMSTALVMGRDLAEKSRLEGELSVAHTLQTSLSPDDVRLPGLELAAAMLPASEVGGDYYDLMATSEGGWLCIGDAVGHGLPAGLLMLMLQSGIGALLRERPDLRPRDVIRTINSLVFDNTQRLRDNRYATLVVARYAQSGLLEFAGGHLDFVLYRAADGTTRMVPTPGSFVGLEEQLEPADIEESTLALETGDVLLMYTDGVTEAKSAGGELFGPERLASTLASVASRPVLEIRDHVLAEAQRFMKTQADDMTLIVLRYSGAPA